VAVTFTRLNCAIEHSAVCGIAMSPGSAVTLPTKPLMGATITLLRSTVLVWFTIDSSCTSCARLASTSDCNCDNCALVAMPAL
jgi:hypothetical protein